MKPFCYAPFVHMYVHNRKSVKICCVSEESDTNEMVSDLRTMWSSKYYQDYREKFIRGIASPHCVRCIENEKANLHSDRMMFKNMYEKSNLELDVHTGTTLGTPIDLDIRDSNLCNLKCRMCSPYSSSQLEKEVNANKDMLGFSHIPEPNVPVLDDTDNIDFLLANINQGKRIKLLGGEPTIMPEVHRILDILIEKRLFDVPLFVTTNVTNNNPVFLSKMEMFNNIHYTFSIDGIGSVAEYIRYPINWKTAEQNMIRYAERAASCNLTYTVQAYNLLHTEEFLYWMADFDNGINPRFEILTTPNWASFRSIPKSIRETFLNKLLKSDIINNDVVNRTNTLKPFIQRCLNDNNEYDLCDFVNITKRFDLVRKHHIKDYIPEVWEFINEEYDDLQI